MSQVHFDIPIEPSQPRRELRRIRLNDGNEIPVLGFGTGTAQAFSDSSETVGKALSIGLTHLDCAWWYNNQIYTAKAIQSSGRGRHELFVSSKGGDFHGEPEEFDAREFLEICLSDLGLQYVDMFLLHADILVPADVTKPWRQMEQIKKDGLAKSIGVSNFTSKSLRMILDSCEIKPAVNQIELHPYSLPHYTPSLLPLCREHDIKIESFGPLVPIIRHPGGPVDVAVQHVLGERGLQGETAGQVLLMWNQQITGGVVITTSKRTERMLGQAAPFWIDSTIPPLSPGHMNSITKAGESAPYRHWETNWPYFMQGEGGYRSCPVGSTHRKKLDDPLAHLQTAISKQ